MERDEALAFTEAVREKKPVTLAQAKVYNRSMRPEDRVLPCCACYNVHHPSNANYYCCTGNSCLYSLNITCFGCLFGCLTYCCSPACWLCVCSDNENNPGLYTCTGDKGVSYNIMKVDAERGTLAWWSYNDAKGDENENTCYCLPLFR